MVQQKTLFGLEGLWEKLDINKKNQFKSLLILKEM